MKQIIQIFYLFCLLGHAALAQDTTKAAPIKLSYTLNWDARNSFVDKKPVNIWGINTGIVAGKKQNQLTLGYYWLSTNSVEKLVDLRKDAAKRLNLGYYTKTNLFYFSFMYWYNFLETKKIKLSMPFEIGIGSTLTRQKDILTEFELWKRKDVFVPLQTGIYFKWKTTKWFGFSTILGYRYSLIQKGIKDKFDGLYYSYGIELNPELFIDTYRAIFRKNKSK